MTVSTQPDSGEHNKSRLKLFFSADIVGSTAYKQPLDIENDNPRTHAAWFDKVQSFYSNADEKFSTHFTHYRDHLKLNGPANLNLVGSFPRVWKTLGDEIIFWKEITSPFQIWVSLAAWLLTIGDLRLLLKGDNNLPNGDKKLPYLNLDVKGSVWLAEFPVRNKVIIDRSGLSGPSDSQTILKNFYNYDPVKNDPVKNDPVKSPADTILPKVDFVGAGIDVGFRVSSFSSANKMPISLDVAYLLAKSKNQWQTICEDSDINLDQVSFLDNSFYLPRELEIEKAEKSQLARLERYLLPRYGGSEPLKGVLGGVAYPKFWISTVPSGSLEESRLQITDCSYDDRRVTWEGLEKFCAEFYKDRSKYIAEPFIPGDPNYPNRNQTKYEEFRSHAYQDD